MTGEARKPRAASAEIRQMDAVLKEVLDTIERCQDQLFDIAEDARREYAQVAEEVAQLKAATAAQIEEVDLFDKNDRRARLRLVEVSQNIKAYSADEVRGAYDNAHDARIRLQVAQEKEALLRRERDSLERRLKRIQDTVRRAEEIVSNITMAFNLLSGRLKDISAKVQTADHSSQFVFGMIMAQEEERRRLARDIHDGPAQILANVVFRIEVCQKLLASNLARANNELDQLKVLVRQSLQDVRKIIFDLRPMALDDLGLVPAIRGYLDGFSERTGIETAIKIYGEEKRLAPSLEVAVFRLVQEALNNAFKHARARTVAIKLECLPSQVRVVVDDDGVGFDVPAALKAQGRDNFGLTGMRERVALLEGSFEIKSVSGRGTRIAFSIPTKEVRGP